MTNARNSSVVRELATSWSRTVVAVLIAVTAIVGSLASGVDAQLCPPAPQAGCVGPALPLKAVFRLRDHALDDIPDRLIWKWLRGSATAKSDFGNPTIDTAYELCVYDATTTLISTEHVPAGGICGSRPCWTETSTGFKYRDGQLAADGVGKLLLREGLEDGKARIIMKGQRGNLNMPALPLAQSVTVQLVNSIGNCWDAVYNEPADHNDSELFKDRAD
jgi:hypothetical protein